MLHSDPTLTRSTRRNSLSDKEYFNTDNEKMEIELDSDINLGSLSLKAVLLTKERSSPSSIIAGLTEEALQAVQSHTVAVGNEKSFKL
ncbi:hypothetical protein VKT23_013370 [Stygiomarasmius scandens]|uniref:Uncharacterized protein n=1 Tax=Marasmiellus scandens TaxID=2682957 RepID=A0ABR1J603_9AGAR